VPARPAPRPSGVEGRLGGGNGGSPDGLAAPAPGQVIREWPEKQRLAYEKEALGFYITSHPLLRFRDEVRRLATTDAGRLDEAPDQSEVRLCGVVSQLKEIMTRKGTRMCRAVLEDLVGFVDLVVFADTYQAAEPLLKGDEPLLVTGTLDRGEERAAVLVSRVERLAEARVQATRTVHVALRADAVDRGKLRALRETLARHPG